MRTNIVSIGNSKGVRIPKLLLEESGLGREVELHVKPGEVRITSPKTKAKEDITLGATSEAAFAKDWLRPEEEDAWAVYQ